MDAVRYPSRMHSKSSIGRVALKTARRIHAPLPVQPPSITAKDLIIALIDRARTMWQKMSKQKRAHKEVNLRQDQLMTQSMAKIMAKMMGSLSFRRLRLFQSRNCFAGGESCWHRLRIWPPRSASMSSHPGATRQRRSTTQAASPQQKGGRRS